MARFFQPKQQTTLNTKHQLVQVERLDHQGAGIAYQGRKPIFIEGALPNEQVLIQWIENKSKYARARLIQVKVPSGLRESPFCPDYDTCGGCNLQHLHHQEQVRYKQTSLLQLMDKIAGQSVELSPAITDVAQGYRRRARLSLKWHPKQKKLAFGFRQKQSNNIVNISHCAVLDPTLNQLLSPMRELFTQFSHPEKLGHVELVAAKQGAVMLLRCLGNLATADRALLEAFAQAQGLMLYLMPEADQLEHLAGPDPMYCEVGVDLTFQPNHFIQVNRNVNHKMVQQALEWLELDPNDQVLDLFCGIGNFSLPIAKQVKRVVGIEGVDDMVAQAQKNAAFNQLSNAVFYQANLEKTLTDNAWATEKFTKVLLDPARAGAKGVIEMIGQLGADRVVYVSCDPATLARDSHSLLAQGYRLEKLGMLDMFPHTSHLESMALFVRTVC